MSKDQHQEYSELVKERFERFSYESYEMNGYYLCVLQAPYQYLNEDAMLAYLRENPTASLHDAFVYWGEITPIGLPPGIEIEDL